MNEQEFGRNLSQQLNRATQELDADTLARLRAARERALERYRAPATALAHAPAGDGVGRLGEYFTQRPRLLFGALALAALAMVSVLQLREGRESPIDAEILASDLPLDAFTHRDFDQWLKDSSH